MSTKKIASPEGIVLANNFLAEFDKIRSIYREMKKLAHDGKMNEVARLAREQESQARISMNKQLFAINELTSADLEKAEREAKEAYNGAKKTVTITSLISLLVGLILVATTIRSINSAINKVISSLTDNSNNVSAAAQQIASSSEELSQAVSEQAASLQETSASVEEMSSMVNRNAEGAKRSRDVADESTNMATRGKETVQDMITAMSSIDSANADIMNQITDSNQKIGEIVTVIGEIANKTKVINDIVFQTKLLSFNASVEAARAGEHGKGFAVVAEEVGNLAQMSGNAAKEISTMLEGSIHKVQSIVSETKSKVEYLIKEGREKVEVGSNVAKQCGNVLDEIVKSIASVSSLAHEISNASDEQARGITEISKAMTQMDQVTQQNAAVSSQAAGAAESLSSQAEGLRHVVQLLVTTVKGGQAQAESSITSIEGRVSNTNTKASNVIVMNQSKTRRTAKTLETRNGKKVVGADIIPSEHDNRFEEV